MTLKTVRIVSLSLIAVGAILAIVFGYFCIETVAGIFVAIMILGVLLDFAFDRCPECKWHLRGLDLYCPLCGTEIDVNKKIHF